MWRYSHHNLPKKLKERAPTHRSWESSQKRDTQAEPWRKEWNRNGASHSLQHPDLQQTLSSFTCSMRLLLLLSRFSRVQLCATPKTAAHQAPPSLRFSRQEHWGGLPFPSPMQESESEDAQSCPTLSDPIDHSLPGSSVHGIFQARVLEWGSIAFSV